MMNETVAPPESTAIVRPAPYVINDTDRSGLIVVVTTFCLVSIWLLFAIRVYIRLKINGPWKIDDTCVALATVRAASCQQYSSHGLTFPTDAQYCSIGNCVCCSARREREVQRTPSIWSRRNDRKGIVYYNSIRHLLINYLPIVYLH